MPVKAEEMKAHDPQKMEQKKAERIEKRLDKLTKDLKLTTDQQAAVKAALESQSAKMADVRKEAAEKSKAIHEETDTQINAVLNDEQKAKYAAIKAEREKKLKEHGWEKKHESMEK